MAQEEVFKMLVLTQDEDGEIRREMKELTKDDLPEGEEFMVVCTNVVIGACPAG